MTYYTVEEVAKVLKLKKSHTYKLIHSGVIPSVRLGRFIRVPESALYNLPVLNTKISQGK